MLVFYFNRLVRYRNRVDTAWQQINVQLTRRHDLIPNLADIVKGYASHEGKVFVEVADARRRAVVARGVGEHTTAEEVVNGSLDTLFMVSEKYPDLKANQDFLRFGEELSRTETRIAGARKYYNGAVMHYDNSRQGFPGNIVASLFSGRFPDREYFEIETPRAREVPEARI
ncbi:MAG: LemA family protein [Actinomycetia bacterium]|nr:LemA family protein [Actinomycetes bacterium]